MITYTAKAITIQICLTSVLMTVRTHLKLSKKLRGPKLASLPLLQQKLTNRLSSRDKGKLLQYLTRSQAPQIRKTSPKRRRLRTFFEIPTRIPTTWMTIMMVFWTQRSTGRQRRSRCTKKMRKATRLRTNGRLTSSAQCLSALAAILI